MHEPTVQQTMSRGSSAEFPVTDALVLESVCKRFGDFVAVDRFDLRVPRGCVLGFLGPNGAGKTTTIRMVMDITRPDSGTVEILGRPHATEVKDRVGYLPEERGLYRKMTVHETLRYFGRLKGLSYRQLESLIDSGLERVGLQDWKKKKVEALSKGMSQKLQFVATILHAPELVILDEPFSGLDPINAEMLKRLMADLRAAGTTVVFSTHQMETAEQLCDRIVLINRGKRVIEGTLAEIKRQFATRMLVLDGAGDFHRLRSVPGISSLHTTDAHARIELATDADPDDILRAALDFIRPTRFELQTPNLQEIFVRLVGSSNGAATTAGATTVGGD